MPSGLMGLVEHGEGLVVVGLIVQCLANFQSSKGPLCSGNQAPGTHGDVYVTIAQQASQGKIGEAYNRQWGRSPIYEDSLLCHPARKAGLI